jgi:ubiquinone/menaquinone biosynthesis C-methylase UbiE
MGKNINTAEYWDKIYLSERGTGKRRIDEDRLQYLIGEMRDWIQYHMSVVAPKIIDLGCGDGEMLRHVHAYLPNWQKCGVDISERALEFASADIPEGAFKTSLQQFPNEYFNVVFCGETLEHITELEAAIGDIFRVLLPGGYAVISVPNENNNPTPEHVHEFTVWKLMKLLEGRGELRNIRVVCNGLSIICTVKKR